MLKTQICVTRPQCVKHILPKKVNSYRGRMVNSVPYVKVFKFVFLCIITPAVPHLFCDCARFSNHGDIV